MEIVGKSGLTLTFEKRQACYPWVGRKFQMSNTLINHYSAIELCAAQMLALAEMSDWSAVVECEQVCRELIQQLRALPSPSGLTPEQGRQRGQILRRILATDAQIRNFVEPAVGRYAHQYRQCAIRAGKLELNNHARKNH